VHCTVLPVRGLTGGGVDGTRRQPACTVERCEKRAPCARLQPACQLSQAAIAPHCAARVSLSRPCKPGRQRVDRRAPRAGRLLPCGVGFNGARVASTPPSPWACQRPAGRRAAVVCQHTAPGTPSAIAAAHDSPMGRWTPEALHVLVRQVPPSSSALLRALRERPELDGARLVDALCRCIDLVHGGLGCRPCYYPGPSYLFGISRQADTAAGRQPSSPPSRCRVDRWLQRRAGDDDGAGRRALCCVGHRACGERCVSPATSAKRPVHECRQRSLARAPLAARCRTCAIDTGVL